MFGKVYKYKSNNTLKNSEKKHLAQRILDVFLTATEEKVKELVPVKSNSSCMKLTLHSGDTVSVYVVDGLPIMLESAEQLIPTVCALWKVPDLIPVITIHSPVLHKMQGGAPLYLPGVSLAAGGGAGLPQFSRGALLAADTQDNAAPALVGRALLSSGDMLYRASGVCLETIHIYGDLLTKDPKFNKIERPKIIPYSFATGDTAESLAADMGQLSVQPAKQAEIADEEWPALGRRPQPARHEPRLIPSVEHTQPATPGAPDQDNAGDQPDDVPLTDAPDVEDEIPRDMDRLLQWVLLTFIKLEGKKVDLPLKTSALYRNHLIPLCPEDRTLDVKKSSYKKMSKFLEAMQKEGLLEVREVEKGVDAVVSVSTGSEVVRAHRVPSRAAPPAPPAPDGYTPPTVREMFCVTAAVAPIFAPLKKGAALPASEVRTVVTQYVSARGLALSAAVTLDHTLAAVLRRHPQETATWEQVMAGVQSAMTAGTEMCHADGSTALTRSRLEPVRMQLVTRSGNKKVTLVSNLEPFGFNLAALSHVCQLGVAASCGVTRTPGAKGDQLMLQGDQTHFVAKLLIEKYGLPKKYVEGADKALKKKNK